MTILGADTIVVVDDVVLGKPEDEQDAARMLRLLSGRKHQVITGVCLLGNAFEDVRSETTTVHFSALSDADIRDYIATGEPMDKAGAYAIQGAASRWISKIEGDYSNVVGLPVALVLRNAAQAPSKRKLNLLLQFVPVLRGRRRSRRDRRSRSRSRALFHRRLKVANAFAEPFAQPSQLAGTKYEESNPKNQEQV